ncbi:endolytic transglycosylase MltG [Williamsia maris]|nr:endolytic transglycosylase MltG [Williamsia maris]
MSDQPNRHRRRAPGEDQTPEEADRLRRLLENGGSGPQRHRRAGRGRPDDSGVIPRVPRDAPRPGGDSAWQEPDRRARPRVIPPAAPGQVPPGPPPIGDTRRDPYPADGPPPAPRRMPPEPRRYEAPPAPSYVDPPLPPSDEPTTFIERPVPPADPDPAADETRTRPPGRNRGSRSSGHMHRRKRRRRITLAFVLVFMIAVVGALGYTGLRMTGYFVNDDNYSNASGTGDVLVQIPQNSSLTRFGQILQDKGVVASVQAFTDAAGDAPISAGFYKLRTGIPAATAVSMLGGDSNRVGRLVIPPGRQLDTKQTADGSPSIGIFEMLAQATTVTINGQRDGVTAEELAQAAATASPADLGVPSWATDAVSALNGDHRRIEGLIAPVAWEMIDPSLTPVQMLRYLISGSADLFSQWGLTEPNQTGLTPYQTLVSASVVEKEVADADDYGKVARVILNRLGKNQRLEMDSTANYTAAVVNIDVSGDAYTAPTKWNTYQVRGLPVTPIGSVGKEPLAATEAPPEGNWIYFVAVDSQGTTLFTDNYEEHLRNRQKACDNRVLAVGCR